MIIMPEDKEFVALLSPEDARELLMALFSEPDDVPELSYAVNIAYTIIKSKSDRTEDMRGF